MRGGKGGAWENLKLLIANKKRAPPLRDQSNVVTLFGAYIKIAH